MNSFKNEKIKSLLDPSDFHFQVMYPAFCDLYRTEQYLGEEIQKDLKSLSNRAISVISVYIHIPWCYGKCNFCFYYRSSNIEEEKEKYFKVLKEEMRWYNKELNKNNIKIDSIYIGGGTPSILNRNDVSRLWNEIVHPLIKNKKEQPKEITVEFHPDSFLNGNKSITKKSVKKKISEWENFKPLRVSVGIQSLIDENLKRIRGENFHYDFKDVQIIVESLNGLMDIELLISYNLDFMWGLRGTDVGEELKKIEKINSYDKVPSYTFYQIWAPHDIESLTKYRKEVEWSSEKIINQRKEIFDWMRKHGYKPYWYPHYFVKNNRYSSTYIQKEATGYYIGIGVNAHSKLPTLTYNNESSLKEYIKISESIESGTKEDREIPPVRYYYRLYKNEQRKRDFLLSLRDPGKKFQNIDIMRFLHLNNEDINMFFIKTGSLLKISDDGRLYVNELIRMASPWNIIPQTNFMVTKIENYINQLNVIDDNAIQNIANDLIFWIARYLREEFGYEKIDGVDIGYRSPVKRKMFWGEPVKQGLNPREWEKKLKEFKGNQTNEYFISLTDLISRQTSKHYCFEDRPVIVNGNEFNTVKGASSFNQFKYFIDNLLNNRTIFLKQDIDRLRRIDSSIFHHNYKAITASWPIWKFLGLEDKYYMIIVKFPSSLHGNIGGLNFVYKNKPQRNKVQKLTNILSNFILLLNYLSEREYNLENKKYALRSAVAAILMESYAHNIGAHGLEGLKAELLNQWNGIGELLNEKNQSILRLKAKLLQSMLPFDRNIKDLIKTQGDFIEFLSYLQGKSAFWSAISRYGNLMGGKTFNIWDLINEFGGNNLLCGSLGASEGYRGIHFFVKFNGKEYDLGCSGMDGDLRYRFEEEELFETKAGWVEAYRERTGITLGLKEGELNTLRDNLQNLKVFLPEGIVGQQAIYTIWENIIRNVKHCNKKKGKGKYIPFYIEIIKKNEKVEIKNWIDLDPVKNRKELEDAKSKMNNWEGVLDKNNRPNMGGTSQNILCVGLINGLDVFDVERFQKSNKKLIKFELNNNKRIVFSFEVWKSKDSIEYKEFKEKNFEEIGPLGRFKIIQLKDDKEENELLKNPFLVRYVKEKANKDFKNLYRKWVEEWVKPSISFITEKGIKYPKEEPCYNYYLYHRDPQKGIKADFHITYKKNDSIGLLAKSADKEENLLELAEILGTKIEIFDDRLYKLSLNIPDLGKLKISAYPEKIPNFTNERQQHHFGIFHLSFLEKETGKNNEKAIEEFFNNNKELLKRYRFIIITTGRGREWWTNLNNDFKKRMKFIPIENLEKCFEDAKLFCPKTPVAGAKYALVKTIFGS